MAEWLTRIDYTDTYAVDLPRPMTPAEFCERVLASAPRWLELLLSARDIVAAPFGFQRQERNYGREVRLEPGAKFGPLCVRSVTSADVVCADADRHLAFRATFRTGDPARPEGRLTTEVQFKDAVGRAYLAVVKPFHQRLIPSLIAAPFRPANAGRPAR